MQMILFIVGAPGVGKTNLTRQLLNHPWYPRPICTTPPEPKFTVAPDGNGGMRVVAAGWYTGETFDGGDTVPYSGAKAALQFWAETLVPACPALTIFDGARFSTGPSLAYVQGFAEEVGARTVGVHLVASEAQLSERRKQRGSNQDPAWIKGATTGARDFAQRIGAVEIEARDPAQTFKAVQDLIRAQE